MFLFPFKLLFFSSSPLSHACFRLLSSHCSSAFLLASSFLPRLLCCRYCASASVCSARCQEGVETHRWSGWFPLSEIWVAARSQISGPRSCDAPPTGFWADLNLTQRFLFCYRVTGSYIISFYASSLKQLCHLYVRVTSLDMDEDQDLSAHRESSQENLPQFFM